MGLLFASLATVNAAEISVTDDAGEQITLARPARRIISLAPALTEILYHVGGGQHLVGTVDHSDYPKAARQVERIGSHDRFDFESILRLQPDLVLAWESGNPSNQVRRLEQLGLKVYRAEPGTLDRLASTILRVGALIGQLEVATLLTHQFQREAKAIQQRYSRRRRLSVFYQVWHDPLITLNGKHLVSEMLEDCGASNVFSDLPDIAPVVTLESVLSRNPQVIIAGGTAKGAPAWLNNWQTWSHIDAVQHNRLYTVNADLLHRYSPRVLDGMRELCDVIEQARRAG